MNQVLPAGLVWESGITMYTDFFPADMLAGMADAALTQEERKVTHDTLSGDPFPDPFPAAARLVLDHTSVRAINTLVVKRYGFDEPSGAFDFHSDPEEYDGWLVLCSPGGFATL